jgi:hypothetical protein
MCKCALRWVSPKVKGRHQGLLKALHNIRIELIKQQQCQKKKKELNWLISNIYTVVHPPVSMGDIAQDPQWILKLRVVPNPICTVFSYKYTPMMKFNL